MNDWEREYNAFCLDKNRGYYLIFPYVDKNPSSKTKTAI